jgi:hypothetical protein
MVNRRRFIAAALALPAAWRASGGGSAAAGDAAPLIQRAIDEAERSGRAVMIPAGQPSFRVSRFQAMCGSSAPGDRAG